MANVMNAMHSQFLGRVVTTRNLLNIKLLSCKLQSLVELLNFEKTDFKIHLFVQLLRFAHR